MIFREMLQDEREAGKAESRIEDILDLLEDLPGEISEDLRQQLFAERDCDVLREYHRLAVSASSVEEFVQRLRK